MRFESGFKEKNVESSFYRMRRKIFFSLPLILKQTILLTVPPESRDRFFSVSWLRARTTGVCEPSASRHFCRKDLLSARRRTRRCLARRRPRLVLRGGNRRCSTVVQRVAEGRPHAQIPRGQQLIWARRIFARQIHHHLSPSRARAEDRGGGAGSP